MISGILKTLTYGQRMQISEGSIALPLDRDDLETWVTKSEERNERAGKPKIRPKEATAEVLELIDKKKKPHDGKGDEAMTAKETCTPNGGNGYFNWTPKPVPQAHAALEFTSCCCEDGSAGLLEALFVFALAKKAANPNILAVTKQFSPNGACSALALDLNLSGNATATVADYDSIVQYYLTLLGY